MRIGIPSSISKTQYYLNQAYADYVQEAGYEPVLITPANNLEAMAEICDGLLLPGGIDIEPTYYGENNVGSNGVDPEKDEFERQSLHTFIGAGKPVFGICRGFQLIVREFMRMHEHPTIANDVDKLVYYQHINGHSMVNDRNISRTLPSHEMSYDANALYGAKGKDNWKQMFVNSIHHQAVMMDVSKNKGKNAGLVIIDEANILAAVGLTNFSKPAKSKKSIVEAIDGLFMGGRVRAVQWHPEELRDVGLLHSFFGAEGLEAEGNGNG